MAGLIVRIIALALLSTVPVTGTLPVRTRQAARR